jgi:hypothetical protein
VELSGDGAAEVLAQSRRWFARMGLTLNEQKTRVCDGRRESFSLVHSADGHRPERAENGGGAAGPVHDRARPSLYCRRHVTPRGGISLNGGATSRRGRREPIDLSWYVHDTAGRGEPHLTLSTLANGTHLQQAGMVWQTSTWKRLGCCLALLRRLVAPVFALDAGGRRTRPADRTRAWLDIVAVR